MVGVGGGGVRRLGPGGDSLLGGADCGGVSWPWYSIFFEKKYHFNPADVFFL